MDRTNGAGVGEGGMLEGGGVGQRGIKRRNKWDNCIMAHSIKYT